MAKKVTVVGAGFYGSTTALRLAEYNIFDTVVLTDILEGKPEGLALDMNQSRSIEGFETKIIGATTTADGAGYEATANSDVVVITAGLPRKPGMSRMDLIGVNAGIVRGVAENIAKHSPNAVIIVVSNPLDEMTALTQLATSFPKNRVMGQAGMLDTARFTNFVAEKLGVAVSSVKTLTLGSHGDTMVPVPNYHLKRSQILSIAHVMVVQKLSHFSRLDLPTTHHLQQQRAWRRLLLKIQAL
jgi:malate dehydrogenase